MTGNRLPPRRPGTRLRLLATNDMLGAVLPLPTTYGRGGGIPGVIRLLEEEREEGPTLWLDCGDQSVGGPAGLFGHAVLRDLGPLPIAAAAVGNHELDDGVEAFQMYAQQAGFPLLCADRDVGVPCGTLIDTTAGLLGLVGITHPAVHELAAAPTAPPDSEERVRAEVRRLRDEGAGWVVALFHDGITWWPETGPRTGIGTRSRQLADACSPWAGKVDAILCGHTLGGWDGELNGTPAGQAFPFAAGVLVVDLLDSAAPMVHPPALVPATEPPASSAVDAVAAAGRRVLGEVDETWTTHPAAAHYLPGLVAAASREATGAEAGLIPPNHLFTQAPVDGIVAALPAGPLTDLDLQRLFPFPDDRLALIGLGPGEFRRIRDLHDRNANPANSASDGAWWNWMRAPAGWSSRAEEPETAGVMAFAVPFFEMLLERDLVVHGSATSARRAVLDRLKDGAVPA